MFKKSTEKIGNLYNGSPFSYVHTISRKVLNGFWYSFHQWFGRVSWKVLMYKTSYNN